tara:strand:- start:325 stop:1953 length:1629 start_codon:yes stop_codon:yes gene_type:complete
MSQNNLFFKSNTARSILGASKLFKHTHLVIWEYVTNELDYRDKNIKPKIFVNFEKDKITISGNGRGMDISGLNNFFTMHGENQERKKGVKIRGLNGTGKSAAFAIGNKFKISTIRNRKLFVIELTKKEIKKYETSGKDIPLNQYMTINAKKIDEPNGTTIEISDLYLKENEKNTVEFIEKHLGSYRKDAEIWVNDHQCKYKEPAAEKTYKFNTKSTHPELGDIDLIIKVSKEPLDNDKIGIRINSNTILMGQTLCGAEGKEMSNFIFGEIDCPRIDEEEHDISASTMARDLTLHPDNPIVKSLFTFIGPNVEKVRLELVEDNNKKKQSEKAKKFQKLEDELQKKFNSHFQKYKDKIIMKVNRTSDGNVGVTETFNANKDNPEGSLSVGDELEAIIKFNNKILKFPGGELERIHPKRPKDKELQEIKDQKKRAKKANGEGKNKSKGGSSFKVEYRANGKENPRAKFLQDINTVFINTDHPYIKKMEKESKDDDTLFKTITYDIAFTEYALGLTNILWQNRFYKENTDEYLNEVRIIVNDLSSS